MPFRIKVEDDHQLNVVIERVNTELIKEKIPIQFVSDGKEHGGCREYTLAHTVPAKLSKEQVERYSAALKCLELARDEFAREKSTEEDLISVACEYGRGIALTDDECLTVLSMQVKDLVNLGI